jgi:hypothetical protein
MVFEGNASSMREALEAATQTGSYEWWPAEDRLVWSAGLLRIYGLDRAPSAEDGFSQLLHPDDRVRVEGETSTYLGSDVTTYSHSFRIVGRTVPSAMSSTRASSNVMTSGRRASSEASMSI